MICKFRKILFYQFSVLSPKMYARFNFGICEYFYINSRKSITGGRKNGMLVYLQFDFSQIFGSFYNGKVPSNSTKLLLNIKMKAKNCYNVIFYVQKI